MICGGRKWARIHTMKHHVGKRNTVVRPHTPREHESDEKWNKPTSPSKEKRVWSVGALQRCPKWKKGSKFFAPDLLRMEHIFGAWLENVLRKGSSSFLLTFFTGTTTPPIEKSAFRPREFPIAISEAASDNGTSRGCCGDYGVHMLHHPNGLQACGPW